MSESAPASRSSEILVSVIVPVHNRERELPRAIHSVLAQTHGAWELLVVDDGSSDGSAAVADSFAARDARIRVIRLEKNGGQPAAENRGIAEASGTWVAFLDSDDEWLPGKLELQLAAALAFEERTGRAPGVVYGWYEKRLADGTIHRNTHSPDGDVFKELLRDFFGITSTLMIRRDVLAECGGFDPQMTHCVEYELTTRIARRHPFAVAREVVAIIHESRRPASPWSPDGFRRFYDLNEPDIRRLLGRRELAVKRVFSGAHFRDAGRLGEAAAEFARALREVPWHWPAWLRLLALPLAIPRAMARR
ncbi:glycosyltransferase family 2 protein [Candidatus Poribacteria bacterium]|nr:glycosyltransferase family 2 protein [Candidatus Poribacteria bacterium]